MEKFAQNFLMFLAAPMDESTPSGGSGDDGENLETSEQSTEQPPADEDQLGEGGKKALQAEREARKQAAKRVAELEAQLAQTGTANQEALQEAQTLAQQAQEDLEAARAEATRYKIAGRYGISTEPGEEDSPSDADLFLTGSTEEELLAQAQRLSSLRKASLEDGLVDPTQGGSGKPAPPSTAEQFAQQLEDF